MDYIEQFHWDVIVVGAGLAGVLTAYYLQEEGKRVLVLEADEVASGQTGRTTAKITSQHGLKYSKLAKTVSLEAARMYAQANEAAIREYERLIQSREIACDFERLPAYLYTQKEEKALQKEAELAVSFGIDAFFTKKTELPFPVQGAVCFKNQAQFNARKFIRHMASLLEIREHTKVISVEEHQVFTEKEILVAEDIVIAAHYPILNTPGYYFLRQHQERSYVLALSDCPKLDGMYIGIDKDGLSFRNMGDCLLLGGGGHRTGAQKKGGSYTVLREAAARYFPESKEEGHWAAQDCMPHDGIPFIGKYSRFSQHIYVATGFQKWGMTTSMVAAQILRDEICGIENPYAHLFSPQRINLRAGIGKFLIDAGVSCKGLFCGWVLRKKPRCPHLGCELVWNPDEKSWDCPCHGSRFDCDGKLLDNPAQMNKL